MKTLLLLLALAISQPTYAKGKAKIKIKIDTTPNPLEDVWTGTFELDYYHITNTDNPATTVYGNPTLDYSGKEGWDIQLLSYNMDIAGGGAQNYESDTYINLSKTVYLPKGLQVVLGTQSGFALSGQSHTLHNVEYGLIGYQPNSHYNIHAGSYWVNKALSTTTDVYGFTGGFSLEVVPQLLSLRADYFSGNNNLSGANVNAWFRTSKLTQLYFGVSVPETNSGNEFARVVGFQVTSK